MSNYLDKWKNAIKTGGNTQSFGIIEDIKNLGDIPSQVREIRNQLQELQQWKDNNAIPTMNINIDNIKAIHSNITDKVVPSIQKNVENIESTLVKVTNAMNKSIEASNLAQSALSQVSTALKNANIASDLAQNAADMAQSSVSKATDALSKSTTIFEKFQLASSRLAKDTDMIRTTANALATSLTTEIANIKNGFTEFGATIYNQTKTIGVGMKNVGDELLEAKNQIATPMNWVKEYASRARNDALIFLPYNVWKIIYWGFIK